MKNIFIVIVTLLSFSYFLLSIDEATIIYSNDKIAAISMNNISNNALDGNENKMSQYNNFNAFINNKKINDYYVTGNIKEGYLDGKIQIKDSKEKLIFEGDLELGVYAGHTRFYNKYGVIYEGYVKNGLQDGFGRNIYFEDGVMRWCYEGDFENGKKNGYGIITVFDDETGVKEYQGLFCNDVFDGKYYKTEKLFVPNIEYIKMKHNEDDEENKTNYILDKMKKSNRIITSIICNICDEITLNMKELIDVSLNKINKQNETITVFNETKNDVKGSKVTKDVKKESIESKDVSNDTKTNLKTSQNTKNKKEEFVNELEMLVNECEKDKLKLLERLKNVVRNKEEIDNVFSVEEALVIVRRLLIDERFINDSNETKRIENEFEISEWAKRYVFYNLAIQMETTNLKSEITEVQIKKIKEFVKNEIKNNNIV